MATTPEIVLEAATALVSFYKTMELIYTNQRKISEAICEELKKPLVNPDSIRHKLELLKANYETVKSIISQNNENYDFVPSNLNTHPDSTDILDLSEFFNL